MRLHLYKIDPGEENTARAVHNNNIIAIIIVKFTIIRTYII